MNQIEIGQSYLCTPVGLKNTVVGTVEQIYTNTVVITVEDCNKEARATVIESQHRMLVKHGDVKEPVAVALVS